MTNEDGSQQDEVYEGSEQLQALKAEILRDFKFIMNKKGRRYLKHGLMDFDKVLKLRNALRSLIQSMDNKSENKAESSSSMSSADASPNSAVADAKSLLYGRPLCFHQTVVRVKKNDAGREETIAYEQKSSRDPTARTPSKRLCRREDIKL